MKEQVLLLMALLAAGCSKKELLWYDAEKDCRPVTEQERDQQFEKVKLKRFYPVIRHQETLYDYWKEGYHGMLPRSLGMTSGILGIAYRTQEICMSAQVPVVKYTWEVSPKSIPDVSHWYRAGPHRLNCELEPVPLDEVLDWVIRTANFPGGELGEREVMCSVWGKSDFYGYLITVTCNGKVSIFTDNKDYCERMTIGHYGTNVMASDDEMMKEELGWE
jgi:hypothetical protein